MTLVEKLNRYLQTLKPFSDEYKVVIADASKSKIEPVQNIGNENTGALANTLLWLLDLKDFLLKQLNGWTAEGEWLSRFKKFYGIKRYIGEEDADYIERLVRAIIYRKETPLAMETILEHYAPTKIIDGIYDSAFADVSFADYYRTSELTSPYIAIHGDPNIESYIVKPARSGMVAGSAYYFIVIMEDLPEKYYKTVAFLVRKMKVAGTFCQVILNEHIT